MLVIVAPCAITGATFDCLKGCHRERINRQRRRGEGRITKGASPARVRRLSAPDQGIDLLRTGASLYLAICQAPRAITGCDPAVTNHNTVHLRFNRNNFYLMYFVLNVVFRVCVYSWLSYSLLFARLTSSPVVSRPTRSPNPSFLTFLIPWFETPVVLPDFHASARITSTSLVNLT